MRKILLAAVVAAVCVVLFSSAQGTAALWSAQKHLSPGTLTTGSLSLAVGDGAGVSQNYEFVGLDTALLQPGGSVQAPLTVANTGTTPLAYSLAGAAPATTAPSGADAALAAAVVLSIHTTADPAACTGGAPSPVQALYEGALSASVAFEAGRRLPAGAAETLCVRVELPANTDQAAAGGSLHLVLSWRGEQE